MAKKIDIIFAQFVQANDLEPIPRWGSGMVYKTGSGQEFTREELEDTDGFAGFIDGICGNDQKGKGSISSEDIGDTFMVSYQKEDTPKIIDPDQLSIKLSKNPITSYEQQYSRGSALRG